MSATNVQFSVAVHIMQALHVNADKRVVSASLAHSVGADPASIRQVLAKLGKAGLVHTTRGRTGACALARPANAITLLEIYRAVAAPRVFAVHAHPVQKSCPISTHHKKSLEVVLDDCQRAFEATLAGTTLSETAKRMKRAG